jgi:hypothetical protein
MRLLDELQGLLHRTYDLSGEHRVTDFLTMNPALVEALGILPGSAAAHEQVLVSQQDEDTVDLAVYIAPEVLERLSESDPLEELHDGNLADFWLALEGVSHFVYIAWNAGLDKPVTRLELELQAEVDKFVALADLLDRWSDRRAARDLHEWLFGQASFDHALAADELQRYRDANRYAGRYCRALGGDSGDSGAREQIAVALRRFYRLPRGEKLRHIEHLDG